MYIEKKRVITVWLSDIYKTYQKWVPQKPSLLLGFFLFEPQVMGWEKNYVTRTELVRKESKTGEEPR